VDLKLFCEPELLKIYEDKGLIQVNRNEAGEITAYFCYVKDQIELIRAGVIKAFDIIDGEPVYWNPSIDRDPRIKGNSNGGENTGQGGFRFNPWVHPKGITLQTIIKPGVLKVVTWIHKLILKGYDEEGYKFDDERLIILNTYLRAFASQYFQQGNEDKRTLNFMNEIFDIFLFLLKEDVYFRARIFFLLSSLPELKLTEAESENIIQFR
jgi:hypothetical protein